jgi:hypothetical protein
VSRRKYCHAIKYKSNILRLRMVTFGAKDGSQVEGDGGQVEGDGGQVEGDGGQVEGVV